MKSFSTFLLLVFSALNIQAQSSDFGSKEEAKLMVKKAIEQIAKNKSETLAAITEKKSPWIDRDLYPVVYDINGLVHAHGQNGKMVGKNVLELKDPNGKSYVQERVDLAKSKGSFWQEYAFTDPITKKVLPKEAYCEKAGDLIVCSGVYKR